MLMAKKKCSLHVSDASFLLTHIAGLTWVHLVLLCTIYFFPLLNMKDGCPHTVSGMDAALVSGQC